MAPRLSQFEETCKMKPLFVSFTEGEENAVQAG